jgi:hypothetical protein
MLEMENDRLNQQLRLLQEQNLLAQNRNKSDKEGKEVHLHISVPKSVFDKRHHKKRKIRKNSVPKQIISEQHTVDIIQPVQAIQPYSYAPQQPYFTVYNFPQEQPTLYSFPQPQQPQQHITDTYQSIQPSQFITYDVPKIQSDARSYHSEPNRRSDERIVKYTASHQPDGTVHIVRSNSYGHIGLRHKPKVPPLDLRDLITPTGNRNKKGHKGNGENEMDPFTGKPGKYKTRPFTTKLSHVSEGAEQGVNSRIDDMADILPPINAQEQGSRSGSRLRPLSRSGEEDLPNHDITDTENRPGSNQTIVSQRSENDSPEGYEETAIEDDTPDVAWQVRRSSPPKYNTYDYQY